MPQLVPFFLTNQKAYNFLFLVIIIYVFSAYILPVLIHYNKLIINCIPKSQGFVSSVLQSTLGYPGQTGVHLSAAIYFVITSIWSGVIYFNLMNAYMDFYALSDDLLHDMDVLIIRFSSNLEYYSNQELHKLLLDLYQIFFFS